MKKITRKTFLKQSLGIGSLLVIHPLMANNAFISFQENALFKRVVVANTKAVDRMGGIDGEVYTSHFGTRLSLISQSPISQSPISQSQKNCRQP